MIWTSSLNLALISIAFLITALSLMFVIWPGSIHKTFSQNAARNKASIRYYAVTFIVFLSMFTLVMWSAFGRWSHYKLDDVWLWYVTGATAQIVAVLVPEVGGRRTYIHRIAADVSAISALLVLIFIQVMSWPWVLIALPIMILIILFTLLKKGNPRYALILQIIYFSTFFAALITASPTP